MLPHVSESDRLARKLLTQYGQAISHMYARHQGGRLVLTLGAGFSRDLEFPDWEDFKSDLARNPLVDVSEDLRQRRHLDKSVALYESFSGKYADCKDCVEAMDRHGIRDKSQAIARSIVESGWMNTVRRQLYAKHPNALEDGTRSKYTERIFELMSLGYHDALLRSFVKPGSLIVNYNFDDVVETFAASAKVQSVSVFDGRPRTTPKKATIYHPNGYLPPGGPRKGSESLVFLEHAFESEFSDPSSYHRLVYLYAEETGLFVGNSLKDPLLCHVLYRAARLSPGHVHYCVEFLDDKDPDPNPVQVQLTRQTLFRMYRVVPLFLRRSEIKVLGEILNCHDIAERIIELNLASSAFSFQHYITGCVSSGKSSLLNMLHDLDLYGEWDEEMPDIMRRDFSTLSEEERVKAEEIVEAYVNKNVVKKNQSFERAAANVGIHVMDRAPLDAMAFVKREDSKRRARTMAVALAAVPSKLAPGHLFLLTGDAYEMSVRSVGRGGDGWAQEVLKNQQELLIEAYGMVDGVTTIDTREKSLHGVLEEVMRAIHLQPYVPANLQARLEQLADEGLKS